MKAVINGDRIECGKCGNLLEKIVEVVKPAQGKVLLLDKTIDEFGVGCYVGCGITLEIKCKHKDRGVYCNEVNEILL